MSSKAKSAGEPRTLASVQVALETNAALSQTRKRDLRSAVKRVEPSTRCGNDLQRNAAFVSSSTGTLVRFHGAADAQCSLRLRRHRREWHKSAEARRAKHCPLCPGDSDVNLFRNS
jgi:hypothetical protein